MPKGLGHVETNPERVVLTLFGLSFTQSGAPLVAGFVHVLHRAIERYGADDDNPTITRQDVHEAADREAAKPQALEEIVLREAPFFDGGTGGPGDDWTRDVGAAVVRYWEVYAADDYLEIRARELEGNPQLGWPVSWAPVAQAESRSAPPQSDSGARDVFISHASEDKADVARPIAEALDSTGWSVWLDEYELTVGDRLSQSINAGLASSRFGVVVLSRAFFDKHWPQEELEALAAKEAASGSKVILPVWHGIDQRYLAEVAPMLAGRLGVSTTKGIPQVARELIRALARERQTEIDPKRREPIVRSVEPSPGEPSQGSTEASVQGLPMSDSARTWLTRFMGMYEGMDTGPGDPVHAVRMKAQEFLDAGPTDEHPPIICKMIAEALPNDPQAGTLGQSWVDEKRTSP